RTQNTPSEIIVKLNKAINEGLTDPKMRMRSADLRRHGAWGSPADFGKLIADETERPKVVKFSAALLSEFGMTHLEHRPSPNQISPRPLTSVFQSASLIFRLRGPPRRSPAALPCAFGIAFLAPRPPRRRAQSAIPAVRW